MFKDAVATYGIPSKLYTDNGAPYVNEQLDLICGAIGCVHLRTKPRDGASKAKIERFWRTAKECFIYGLDIDKISSLDEFNRLFKEYLRSYNLTRHSGIDCTPFDRYKASKDRMPHPKSREWLDECFLNRINRKVRKDSTVSIDKVSFDVPQQFIGQTVEIRFRPGEMDSAVVFYEDGRYPLRPTNKNDNCHTKRSNPVIDYSKIGQI